MMNYLLILMEIFSFFRLDNENDLKIFAYSYFKDIINLIELDKNNNIFYDDGIVENYRRSKKENSKVTSISIYY